MKTNEKYEHQKNQPPIQDGEHPLDFARRVFPDKKNIQYGAPEYNPTPEDLENTMLLKQEMKKQIDELFGDDPEKEIKL